MTNNEKFAALDLDGEHPGEAEEYEDKIERIKALSFKTKWQLCKDKIEFFDKDFQKILLSAIYYSFNNKDAMYEELFNMIAWKNMGEIEKYLKNFIYDNELIK